MDCYLQCMLADIRRQEQSLSHRKVPLDRETFVSVGLRSADIAESFAVSSTTDIRRDTFSSG